MSLEIESLLYKQVKKPKNHLMTKVINLWDNRYRINIYVETCELDSLVAKRTIAQSYFCHYYPNNLVIVDDHMGVFKRSKDAQDCSLDIPQESGILVEV